MAKTKSNIVIGAGRLYADLLDAGGKYTGERYLGDAVGAALSIATERTQVFSGSGPVAEKLADIVRSVTRSMTLTLHDMSAENLALFVSGEAASEAQAAAAVVDEALTVNPGRWYQLGATPDKPGGVGAVSATTADTVVTNKDATTTHDAGDDYTVDAERGRLHIVAGGAIAAAAEIKVDYKPATATRETVKTGKAKQVQAAIRYVEDAAKGKGRNVYARLCSVGASGELALMDGRNAEQQLQLTAEVQEPGDGWPALSLDGEAA